MNFFLIGLLALSIACFVTQATILSNLQESGSDLTIWIQSWSTFWLDDLFRFLSDFSIIALTLFGLLIYCGLSIKIGEVITTVTLFSIFITEFLKMVYSQPRPFWIYSEIKGIKCETGWGAPSGHAIMAGAVIGFLGGFYINTKYRPILSVILMSILIFIIDLDRLYLGVHFYFQVIQGNLIGFLIADIFLRPKPAKWLHKITSDWRKLLIIVLFCALLYVTNLMLFLYRKTNWENKWTRNIKKYCDGEEVNDTDVMKGTALDATIFIFLPGFWIGRFLLRIEPVFRKRLARLIGVFNLAVLLVIDQTLEYLVKINTDFLVKYVCYSLIRFFLGLSVGFLAPKLAMILANYKKPRDIRSIEFGKI